VRKEGSQHLQHGPFPKERCVFQCSLPESHAACLRFARLTGLDEVQGGKGAGTEIKLPSTGSHRLDWLLVLAIVIVLLVVIF
jgi:hypothetical protein